MATPDSSSSRTSSDEGPFTSDFRLSIPNHRWDSGISSNSEHDAEDNALAEALADLGRVHNERKELLHEMSTGARLPAMNVLILVVGTHGDVAPFCALGKELRAQGHRVRIGTHTQYRTLVVEENGLEYYPLAGDPGQLSEFMVKTGGKLIPDSKEAIDNLPAKLEMMRDIIFSTYPAATMPDTDGRPFTADAIISNPPTYGHNHVAEALGVPLHLMFPQPWVPTYAFPHPLACIDRQRRNFSYKKQWSRKNRDSYYLVQKLEWVGMGSIMNSFRFSIGLDIKPALDMDKLYQAVFEKVPFVHMWSPAFVPKPPDWGPLVDVVGNFFTNKLEDAKWTPPDDLAQWLAEGSKPILVTFGSMKFCSEALTHKVYKAATRTGVRVLLQSGWSELGMKGKDPKDHGCFIMGRAPHDWLMQRCSAVIHHGGAGTTAAGLRCGLPTFICPFFGDQHFWGEMIYRAQLGPKPCPLGELTRSGGTKTLEEAFKTLENPETQRRAVQMAEAFSKEDGVKGGAEAFNRHLPVATLACTTCLNLVATGLLDKPYKAEVEVEVKDGVRVSFCIECFSVLREAMPEEYGDESKVKRLRYMKWGNDGPEHEDDDNSIAMYMLRKSEVTAKMEAGSKASAHWWDSTGERVAVQIRNKANQIVTDSLLKPEAEEDLHKAGYGPSLALVREAKEALAKHERRVVEEAMRHPPRMSEEKRDLIVRFRNQIIQIQSVLTDQAGLEEVETAMGRSRVAKEEEACIEIKCTEKYFAYTVKGTLKIYPSRLEFVVDEDEKTPTSDGGRCIHLPMKDIYDTWATKGISSSWHGFGVFVQTFKARFSRMNFPLYSYNFSGMSSKEEAVSMHKEIERARVAYATTME